jgi:hypothetical protein
LFFSLSNFTFGHKLTWWFTHDGGLE